MRIGLPASPHIPVPPPGYGGTERVIDSLAVGLAERGHAVTVFARSHPVTQSPSHPVTQSPSHPVTQSPSHPVTQSPSHP